MQISTNPTNSQRMKTAHTKESQIEDEIRSFKGDYARFHTFAKIRTKGKGQHDIYQNVTRVCKGLKLLEEHSNIYLRNPLNLTGGKEVWVVDKRQALSFLTPNEEIYYPTLQISRDRTEAFLDLKGRKVDFLKLMVDFDYERQQFTNIKVISDQNILGYITFDKDGVEEYIKDGIYVDLHFRKDRRWQINWALLGKIFKFPHFPVKTFKCLNFIHMRPDKRGPFIKNKQFHVVFPDIEIRNTLGEVLSNAGIRQFRIAEKEKYSHITEFLNGGRSANFHGEHRVLVPSPKVEISYAEKPEMSAYEVTEELIDALKNEKYHFFVANYANPDMVGHTGDLAAAITAIGHVDINLVRLLKKARKRGINTVIVADHGNADQMIKKGEPFTQHTTNPVPFIYIPSELGQKVQLNTAATKTLAGVAPSILAVMGINQPKEMDATRIIDVNHNLVDGEYQKAMLIVLDGLGLNKDKWEDSDAIRRAIERGEAPLLKRLLRSHWDEESIQFEDDDRNDLDELVDGFLMTEIEASEQAVGLPENQFGNSEVGHTHLGAGRKKVPTDFGRFTAAIKDGSYATNSAFHAIKAGDHVMVNIILSDGGVHSYIEHLRAFLKIAKTKKAGQVFVHAALDGRDVDAISARNYLDWGQRIFDEEGIGEFSIIYGRELHDRAQKFYITEALYRLTVFGETFDSWPSQSEENSYILTKLRASRMNLSEYAGKIAFIQADLQINMDDSNRRHITLKTIIELSRANAKVIVGSHDHGHGKVASQHLNEIFKDRSIYFDKGYHTAYDAKNFIQSQMQNGDILFLNNLLEYEGESSNDPAFSKKLFNNVNLYISDNPRISHFKYASIFNAPKNIPRSAGCNLEAEMTGVESIRDEGQEIAVIGGANISLKLNSMERLLNNKVTNNILLGADIALLFRKAQGFNVEVVLEEIDPDDVALIRKLLKFDYANDRKFLLPLDLVIVDDINDPIEQKKIAFTAPIPEGFSVVDIGPKTIDLYRQKFIIAKSIYWNGQMGYYNEKQLKDFAGNGTQMIAQALRGVSGNVISAGFHTEEIINYFNLKFDSVLSSLASRMLKGGAWPAYEALSSAIEGEKIFPPNKLTYDYLNRVIKIEDFQNKHKIAVDTKINKLDYKPEIKQDTIGRIAHAKVVYKVSALSEESSEIFIVTEGVQALAALISRDFPQYKVTVSEEPTVLQEQNDDYRRGEKSLYCISLEMMHRDFD